MRHPTRWWFVRSALCVVAIAAGTADTSAAGSLTVGTGIDYSTGKYGGSTATEVLYVPFYARAELDRWLFRLTVPQINIRSQGRAVIVDGRPVVIPDPSMPRTTASGIGDTVAAIGYNILDSERTGLIVDLYGKVKFPTGDSEHGLGTGEYDYALQIDLAKAIRRVSLLSTVGYRSLGNPPGIHFRDVWYGSAGLTYRIDDLHTTGVLYDYREPSTAQGFHQSELTAFLSRRITPELKLQIYGIRGLSEGSPAWGAGVMLSRRF